MIGWKCKWGYNTLTRNPTSYSEITWTDNSVFTIPLASTGSDITWENPKIDEIVSVLLNNFGDEYYTLYGCPHVSNVAQHVNQNSIASSIADSIIPSYRRACPRLYDIFNIMTTNASAPDINFNCFIEIPTLQRIVGIMFYNSSNIVAVWSYNGNNFQLLAEVSGDVTPISISSFEDWKSTGSGINTTVYAFIVSLKTTDDLLNLSNYYRHLLRYTISNKGVIKASYRFEIISERFTPIFTSLFSYSQVPDFEGELPEPSDPMEPIGPSGPGGGNGSFDKDSDIIEDSSLPTLSAADTGFTRIYSPTLSQVQSLARYLWTDETVIETIWNKIKQIFENPMDAIIAFNLVPVPVEISGTKNFALMYIDTGVSMNTVQNQFVDVDCGTFEIKEYYGSALDYSPNTKISCFLPFIGVVTLNTDEVMNTTLQVKYRVDIVSGSCVAKVFVNGSVLYQFSGHCSIPIPFTASDYSSYLSAAIGVAKLAIGAAVGGGAGAAAAGASEIDVEQATQGIDFSNMSADESVSATMAAMDEARSKNTTAASYKGIASQNITNVVGTVMGAKLHVEHSGSFSGNTGYLGVRRPYLIIQRPRMCMPNEYRKFNGYPSMITLNIGDCKGYTKVQQIQLQGVSATNPEQSEILQLLKGGIII